MQETEVEHKWRSAVMKSGGKHILEWKGYHNDTLIMQTQTPIEHTVKDHQDDAWWGRKKKVLGKTF